MRRVPWWLPGLVLALVGVSIFLAGGSDLGNAGPFTYDHPISDSSHWSVPASDASASLPWLWVTRAQLTGAAVVIVGLMALAAGAGYRWGRRRPTR